MQKRQNLGAQFTAYRLLVAGRMWLLLLLGVSSGLPLVLTASTLQAWYTVAGVSTIGIGFLSLVGYPYLFKCVWAPLIDRFSLPFFGRRRGWIALFQIASSVVLVMMANISPKTQPILLAVMAFILAFLSASQDICLDAYRTEILSQDDRGVGNAFFVTGYRLGMLLAGSLALIMAAVLGWHATYLMMALFMALAVLVTIMSKEPRRLESAPMCMKQAIVAPLQEFFSRKQALFLLCFILLYKLGDAFALSLSSTFLLRGLGFSLVEVGAAMKTTSVVAVIVGGFIGGVLQVRLGLFKSLMLFGFFQAISNIGFMILALVGKQFGLMLLVISIDYLAGGMGAIVFLAFLMGLCHQRHTATQFALLSAVASIGRVIIGPVAGVLVHQLGWASFYFSTFVVGLIPLGLLYCLKEQFSDTKSIT